MATLRHLRVPPAGGHPVSESRASVLVMHSGKGPGAGPALDERQRAVVELAPTAAGVVVGAPGTGKTTTLVERVASLVAGGMSPDAIVVLTPSRQSATLLRDRLALAVDRATAGPLARSVASLAFQIVRAYEVHAHREPPQLLTARGGTDWFMDAGGLFDGAGHACSSIAAWSSASMDSMATAVSVSLAAASSDSANSSGVTPGSSTRMCPIMKW